MRYVVTLLLALFLVLSAVGAQAALPYYNGELGYTIWLPKGWVQAPERDLTRFADLQDGLGVSMTGWQAGYAASEGTRLLVTELHGRVVSKAGISNFNRFVVREIIRAARDGGAAGCVHLKSATFDSAKNILRLEMILADCIGKPMLSVVHVVYTRNGMLKFTGLAEPDDGAAVEAIDQAVASLYLENGLRQ